MPTAKPRPRTNSSRSRETSDAPPRQGTLSQTVVRALSILRSFDRDRRELGVTEISHELALPKTIVFRLIQTLKEHDFLEQNPDNSKYRIGIGAFEVGNLFKSSTLEAESAPFMRHLVDQTGHTAQLAVLHRNEMVIIARMEGRGPVKYGVSVGERRPIYCSAVGKAVLSILGSDQVESILNQGPLKKMTPNTITERKALIKDLAQTRSRGYSVNWEENTIGVASLAAPVTSRHAHTLAALALAFPASAAAKKDLTKIGELLSTAARSLAARV